MKGKSLNSHFSCKNFVPTYEGKFKILKNIKVFDFLKMDKNKCPKSDSQKYSY